MTWTSTTMPLRDLVAVEVMKQMLGQGLRTNLSSTHHRIVAETSYAMADMMMEVREQIVEQPPQSEDGL